MKNQFVIEFGRSRSKYYSKAVDIASKHPTYSRTETPSGVFHSVVFDDESLDEFFALLEVVQHWASASFYVNGKRCTPSDVLILKCYRERLASPNPAQHCRCANLHDEHEFPCRFIDISRHSADGLTQFGFMDDSRIFHVDKAQLHDAVMRQAEPCTICPAFDLQAILRAIHETPDTIDPGQDPTWEYVSDYEQHRAFAGVRQRTQRELRLMQERRLNRERDHRSKPGLLNRLLARLGLVRSRNQWTSGSITVGPSLNIRSAADAKQHGIVGAQWNARLDKDTCPLCEYLHGRVISVDHPDFNRFVPPLHDGCKCVRVYIGADQSHVEFNWETPSEDLISQHAPHLV